MNSHSRSHLQRPTNEALPSITGILKRSVTNRLCTEFGEKLPASLFRRAVSEAEAIAHATGFPNLFFPALAEEKVRMVSEAVASDMHGKPALQFAA